MFDYLSCHYPLSVAGANDLVYQTKDTEAQFLDVYEIRADGTLWHEEYDTEDHSPAGQWLAAHPGEKLPEALRGLSGLVGALSRVNQRWVPTAHDGRVLFYAFAARHPDRGWIEWSAVFVKGRMVHGPELILHEMPDPAPAGEEG